MHKHTIHMSTPGIDTLVMYTYGVSRKPYSYAFIGFGLLILQVLV